MNTPWIDEIHARGVLWVLARLFVIASSCYLTGLLSGACAVVLLAFAEGQDSAGLSALTNPFVIVIWAFYSVIGSSIAAPTAVLALWRSDLRKSIPATMCLTIAASAVFRRQGMFSAFPTLAVGILSLVLAGFLFHRSDPGKA